MERKVNREMLTCVGSRQVVPGIGLFYDVFMNLVPLNLCVASGMETEVKTI